MALFEVRGLARRPWIEGFDLALAAGEAAVLRGPSGSGKTLLLRALADLDPCDAGDVVLGGRARETFAPTEWRRRVRYVHQAAPALAGTVAEDLARVRALGAAAGGDATDGPPGVDPAADTARLSGGERQRLALFRALLARPDVLLLDEATVSLDADAARAAEERVRGFARAGGAVLWVSHDGELAERLGAREVRLA